jgi:hypothetical protein
MDRIYPPIANMFGMTVTQNGPVTRDDIEQALWRWTGWTADQRKVDDVLSLVDRLVSSDNHAQAPDVQHEAEQIIARAREEAEQVVRGMRDEAMLHSALQKTVSSPRKGFVRAPSWDLPAEAFRDHDGALWVRIEAAPGVLAEGSKPCTQCGAVKQATHFRREKNSATRRKQCRDCENSNRRARSKSKVTKVVQL